MAVRDKRAGYRCESCRKYAILKSYHADTTFFIYGRKNKWMTKPPRRGTPPNVMTSPPTKHIVKANSMTCATC
nr:MAG TPA_asm: hypothetical protein [Bacteriophage sp.]